MWELLRFRSTNTSFKNARKWKRNRRGTISNFFFAFWGNFEFEPLRPISKTISISYEEVRLQIEKNLEPISRKSFYPSNKKAA
ncbi:hypothetical protein DLM78_00405 [Leptospira stimsonii]|uniref:Uncharacterized protein n=1 Tax=Leptospira stimsonii TaxID=2202203 RepID=A0A8B3CTF9_9LEPT|nr:hypothetical protein DLM78_00405 [Leptospira stimsonii]